MRKSIAFWLFLLAKTSAWTAPAITEILGRPTDRSITVNARADAALELYFEYGLAPSGYTAQTAKATPAVNAPFEMVMDGLRPNTRYYYRTRYRNAGSSDAYSAGYVVGGRFEAGFQSEKTDRIEVFDPATGSWTTRAPMPRPRGGVNAIEAMGCLHVFGGEGNDEAPSGVFPDHDVYNPVTDTWIRLGPMPVPVHGVTGAAFTNGLIHLPGGGISLGGSSGSTIHQVYRPMMTCR